MLRWLPVGADRCRSIPAGDCGSAVRDVDSRRRLCCVRLMLRDDPRFDNLLFDVLRFDRAGNKFRFGVCYVSINSKGFQRDQCSLVWLGLRLCRGSGMFGAGDCGPGG